MTREFPKAHLFAAGGLGLAVTIMLLLSPSSEVEANRISIPLKIGAENITKETPIKEYEKVLGEKPHHMAKAETLLAKISEHKE